MPVLNTTSPAMECSAPKEMPLNSVPSERTSLPSTHILKKSEGRDVVIKVAVKPFNSVTPKLVNIPKLIYILPTPAWASCSPSSCAACPDCSAAHSRQCRQSFLSHTPSYS